MRRTLDRAAMDFNPRDAGTLRFLRSDYRVVTAIEGEGVEALPAKSKASTT